VQEIAGGKTEVITLVGPSADSFRLTPLAAKALLQIVLDHRKRSQEIDE